MQYLSILKNIIKEKKAYIVGGFIRDYLLNKKINDIDIILMSDIDKIVNKFKNTTNTKMIILDEKRKIYRVIVDKNLFVDFSNPVGQDLKEDLGYRDFTINSMAIDINDVKKGNKSYLLHKDNIIDPFNGKKDIDNKIIRMVDKAFVRNDPIRILRAYRFANDLDFSLETKTMKIINKNEKLLYKVKNERIKDELLLMFSKILNKQRVKEFLKSDLLYILFNINTYKKEINRNEYLTSLNYILEKSIFSIINIKKYMYNIIILFLAPILYDDITLNELNNTLIKYTFNKKDTQIIIEYLFFFKAIIKNSEKYLDNKRSIYQDFYHLNINLKDMKSVINTYYTSKENKEKREIALNILNQLQIMKNNTKEKFLDGNEIKKLLNVKEGEIVGKILKDVELQKALGKLKNKNETIKHIKNKFKRINND